MFGSVVLANLFATAISPTEYLDMASSFAHIFTSFYYFANELRRNFVNDLLYDYLLLLGLSRLHHLLLHHLLLWHLELLTVNRLLHHYRLALGILLFLLLLSVHMSISYIKFYFN